MTLRGFTLARLIFSICVCTSPAFADNLTGQASVIDGDTLEIHGTRVRLWGIDAPESSQLCRNDESLQYRCGAKAANDLDAFVARRPVDCSPVSLDQYGRTVARCSIDGVDIADWLVRNGLALDWPMYSKGKYREAQREAEHGGRGMWAGSYVEPWLFRACVGQGGKPNDCSDDARKGKISMADLWSGVGVFALGGVGWVVTSFVGQPFRQFFDLRKDVIHKSVLYDNVRAVEKVKADDVVEQTALDEDGLKRLREAQDSFRDLAARMRAFALNEPFAVRLVSLWNFDPLKASTALLAVSNTLHRFGGDRAAAKSQLEQVLRFRTVVG